MRIRVKNDGIVVNAVAGCHVVTLGLDIDREKLPGLRGFAVRRTDHNEGETFWMKGSKTFESVKSDPAPGEQFSSLTFPFQTFQWSDYTVKPGRPYSYDVVALYGNPARLEQRGMATVAVATEPVDDNAEHVILFNRGAVATQQYARQFQNKPPSEVGPGAYRWLSRGLLEGILEFIASAADGSFGLRGAFYEFRWPAVLDALKEAKARGADVRIVFDDIESSSGPWDENEDAIEEAGIREFCRGRRNGTLMHNKFLVLTRHGEPKAVLTGSTNITENGIFGHANCVHIVRDAGLAAEYLSYFEKLAEDPTTKAPSAYKQWTVDNSPAPRDLASKDIAVVFSPRTGLEALDWYGELAGKAAGGLFMTFAFGMNERFRAVYGRDDETLRMAVMEKEWTGRGKEEQIAAIRVLQARSNVVIAIGNRIPLSGFDQWLGELDRIVSKVNVHWIHNKFMLVDPLSDDPIVVTGSANFSPPSTTTNDENMLVIRGNTRVADIYLGEFMRLHAHYAFRQALAIYLEKHPDKSPDDFEARFLVEEGDWTKNYFDEGHSSGRFARRVYFSGQKNASQESLASPLDVPGTPELRHDIFATHAGPPGNPTTRVPDDAFKPRAGAGRRGGYGPIVSGLPRGARVRSAGADEPPKRK